MEHETFVGNWVTFQRGLTIFYSVWQVKKRSELQKALKGSRSKAGTLLTTSREPGVSWISPFRMTSN